MLNDTYGHQAGDDCLRQVGACLQTQVRATDVAARYGGEEFVILLPKTNYSEAAAAAERVRAAIEAMAFPHPSSRFGVTTVSVGYSTFQRGALEDGKAIVKAADEALYYVKRKSRNAIAGCRDLEKPAAGITEIAVSLGF
jgi:diguanylate cyclase (GGDEF)-like protein